MRENVHAMCASMPMLFKEYGGAPVGSQLHITSSLMSGAVLAAPDRAAAAAVAAELGFGMVDPAEFLKQNAMFTAIFLSHGGFAEVRYPGRAPGFKSGVKACAGDLSDVCEGSAFKTIAEERWGI